jgi:hypothetical protein
LVLLSTKDEAVVAFKTFQARDEAEAGRKFGSLCTDHGEEFTARNFLDHDIQCHLTAPYTPEQNGVVARQSHPIFLGGGGHRHSCVHTKPVFHIEC